MQTQEFLSIKEAAERYSKAEITIRRFVRNVLKNSSAKERQMIRPLPDEAAKLKKKGRPFAYTINESLLKEKFFAEQGMEKTPKAEVLKMPEREEIESDIDEQLITEFYSR